MVVNSIFGRRTIIGRLVLAWVTVLWRKYHVSVQPAIGPTQPSSFSGMENEYRPKCGDALRLEVKA